MSNATMKTKIRDWYMEKYPSDSLGTEIAADNTFADLMKCLEEHHDVYGYRGIGVGDSVIRERMFKELADIRQCDYDVIYELWLEGGRRR